MKHLSPLDPKQDFDISDKKTLNFNVPQVIIIISFRSINCLTVSTSREVESISPSVTSNSVTLGLQPASHLCSWDSSGKNTWVGCHFLLQRILPTQGSNLDLLHCRQILYRLSHQGRFFFSWETMIWSVWGCRAEGKNLTSLGEFAQGSLENP